MRIQVCFQVKDEAHNAEVKEKLKALKATLNNGDIVMSCHLPKSIVEAKGWSTEMCDALTEIFGNQYLCMVYADTFDEAMDKMNVYRRETALKADKIFVIGEQSVKNIALEIQYFTNNRVQFI